MQGNSGVSHPSDGKRAPRAQEKMFRPVVTKTGVIGGEAPLLGSLSAAGSLVSGIPRGIIKGRSPLIPKLGGGREYFIPVVAETGVIGGEAPYTDKKGGGMGFEKKMFRLRASDFPTKESRQSSPGPRPRSPGAGSNCVFPSCSKCRHGLPTSAGGPQTTEEQIPLGRSHSERPRGIVAF